MAFPLGRFDFSANIQNVNCYFNSDRQIQNFNQRITFQKPNDRCICPFEETQTVSDIIQKSKIVNGIRHPFAIRTNEMIHLTMGSTFELIWITS
jgi:hypothetical protein